MLRAILALGGTAAGLAALLSFKTHMASEAAPAPSTPSTPAAASPTMSAASPTKSAASQKTTGSGGSAQARSVTGTVAMTQYGPMQVKVTLEGKKITGVDVVQKTDSGAESQQIDSFSIPKLTSETLAAQSANIQAVSGASYTSSGYIKSLQSALDQASA